MNVLHLTLKKQWFDMIASGEKTEEYRELKDYWAKRLHGRHYDAVQFRNGYSANAPTMIYSLKGIRRGHGIQEWGAPDNRDVYILSLGQRIQPPTTLEKGIV